MNEKNEEFGRKNSAAWCRSLDLSCRRAGRSRSIRREAPAKDPEAGWQSVGDLADELHWITWAGDQELRPGSRRVCFERGSSQWSDHPLSRSAPRHGAFSLCPMIECPIN